MKYNYNVLYVEDEIEIRIRFEKIIGTFFNNVYSASEGKDALEKYYEIKPNIIILDLNLPYINGLEVAKKIRETDKDCIIVVLSGLNDIETLINACEVNLLKYLIKPVKTIEFEKTIKLAIDKLNKEFKHLIQINDIIIDKNKYIILKNSKEISISKKEFELINLLLERNNQISNSDDLINLLWEDDINNDFNNSLNKLRALIHRINKKLSCEFITSIYGIGYKINDFT